MNQTPLSCRMAVFGNKACSGGTKETDKSGRHTMDVKRELLRFATSDDVDGDAGNRRVSPDVVKDDISPFRMDRGVGLVDTPLIV